jgi:membrane-bound lytic murein transglycosylase D
LLASASAACASGSQGRPVQVSTTPVVSAAPGPVDVTPPADPVQDLIAAADRHFENGRNELGLGHLARAKASFNSSLELLMQAPDTVRDDARVRQHLDRLVDRIAALELTALASGDGFTERAAEPASIDQLLAISTFDTTPPTAATVENVQLDLQETSHDLPIPLNQKVLRYVELFQTRLREFLSEGLQRGTQYLPMIQSVFRAEGLPLDLAYVPLIESAFKPTALSRAKAKGVWQFMSGTGLENGLKNDWYIDERSDPQKATVAAAKYLKTLFGMFDDWHLAMASYNGGPGRVQRAVKRSGLTDFWSLSEGTRFLPRETRDYVPMILAAVIIAKNPVKYGFDITPLTLPEVETVPVPPAVDLRRVAEWAGVSADDIQRLNPELRRWTTPIRGDDYLLAVPEGSAGVIRTRLAESHPDTLNAHGPGRGQLRQNDDAIEGGTEAAHSEDAVGGASGPGRLGRAGSGRTHRRLGRRVRGCARRGNGRSSCQVGRVALLHRQEIPDDGGKAEGAQPSRRQRAEGWRAPGRLHAADPQRPAAVISRQSSVFSRQSPVASRQSPASVLSFPVTSAGRKAGSRRLTAGF